jgi:hypothetical protein
MTSTPAAQFGVCVLQVELEPEQFRIKITTTRYLAPGARRAVTTQPKHYASVKEALLAVNDFLSFFADPGNAPEPVPAEPRSS